MTVVNVRITLDRTIRRTAVGCPAPMNYSRFKLLTFDVVGTLIDFESGILGFFDELGCQAPPVMVLEAFGEAEGRQQIETPEMPFTQMLEPIYEHMVPALGLSEGQGSAFRASIALARLPRQRGGSEPTRITVPVGRAYQRRQLGACAHGQNVR